MLLQLIFPAGRSSLWGKQLSIVLPMKMKIITSIALLVILVAPAFAQITRDDLPPDMAKQVSDSQLELMNWMMFYYQKPVPEDFPSWLRKASEAGLLRDDKSQFPFLGFGASVFVANAENIPRWISSIDALPEEDRKTVLVALWLSGTKASEKALSEGSRQKILRDPNYYDFDTEKKPPNLDLLDQKYTGFLDIQWGRFCASGQKKPIRLIIKTLEYGRYFRAIEKYRSVDNLSDFQRDEILMDAIHDAAVWSLISNCIQHELVKRYCIEIYENVKLGEYEKSWLGMVLTKAAPEKYELINRGKGKGLMVCPVDKK